MIKAKAFLAASVAFMISACAIGSAFSQDEARKGGAEHDAASAMLGNLAAHNGGRWQEIAKSRLPGSTTFGAGGGVLHTNDDAVLKQAFEAGFGSNLRADQLSVKVHGDTAIITCYLVGHWILEDKTEVEGTWRFSEVRIKNDGGWMIAHTHISPLSAPGVELRGGPSRKPGDFGAAVNRSGADTPKQ